MKRPVTELRALMNEHGLTYSDVAQLAGVSVKTVEGWLAAPSAAMHRGMAARNLAMIRAMLPGFLAAGRKGE